MSSLLELAADFFDRMANPAYGAQVNEENALRFGSLLDGGLDERVSFEASQLRSTKALSPFGWMWVIGWAKSRSIRLDRDLLTELCEEWESATFKAAVIDLATLDSEEQDEYADGVDDVTDPWLRNLLTRAVEPPEASTVAGVVEPDENHEPSVLQNSLHSHSLLIALLVVDRDVTLDAASALLRHTWEGQRSLLEFFWSRMDGLDSDTRSVWQDRLDPPEREDQHRG